MEDLFKKFVNAGVGYIAQGSKSVQNTIDKLVQDNKMTQAEGKKIVDELMKSGETKRTELEKQFQGIMDRAKSTVGLGDNKPKGKAGAKKGTGASTARTAAAKPAAAKSAAKAATKTAAKPAAKAAAKPAAKAAAKPAATAAKAEDKD